MCCWWFYLVAESACVADQTTTAAPTTTVTTTTAPTAPTPPGNPDRGTYTVSDKGATCLLAQMGLQLNISYFSRSQNKVKRAARWSILSPLTNLKQHVYLLSQTVQSLMNLTPNATNSTGSCQTGNATLILTQQTTVLSFTFTLVRASFVFYKFSHTIFFFCMFIQFVSPVPRTPQAESTTWANCLCRLIGPIWLVRSCSRQHVWFRGVRWHRGIDPVSIRSSVFSQQRQSELPEQHARPLLHVQQRAGSGRDARILTQHVQTANTTLWHHHQPVFSR